VNPRTELRRSREPDDPEQQQDDGECPEHALPECKARSDGQKELCAASTASRGRPYVHCRAASSTAPRSAGVCARCASVDVRALLVVGRSAGAAFHHGETATEHARAASPSEAARGSAPSSGEASRAPASDIGRRVDCRSERKRPRRVRSNAGGLSIVQAPSEAPSASMPEHAIAHDHVRAALRPARGRPRSVGTGAATGM
jgi:hypothetical protein